MPSSPLRSAHRLQALHRAPALSAQLPPGLRGHHAGFLYSSYRVNSPTNCLSQNLACNCPRHLSSQLRAQPDSRISPCVSAGHPSRLATLWFLQCHGFAAAWLCGSLVGCPQAWRRAERCAPHAAAGTSFCWYLRGPRSRPVPKYQGASASRRGAAVRGALWGPSQSDSL